MEIQQEFDCLVCYHQCHKYSYAKWDMNTPRRQAFAFSGGPLYFSLQRSFRELSPVTRVSQIMVFNCIVYNDIET